MLRKTKNILAKFSYPKKLSQNGKFGAPENPAIIPFTLTSEYRHPPPPPLLWCCHCDILLLFLYNNNVFIVFKGKRSGETTEK